MTGSKNATQEGSRHGDSENEDDSGLERDIELLHDRICEFEIYLMQMDAVVEALQKENERFHQEVKFEKIHNADLKNELKKTRRQRVIAKSETGKLLKIKTIVFK